MTNLNGIELTEDERNTLTHGLRIAAERFALDAKICMEEPAHPGLAEQFRLQVVATLALVERLDNAEFVRVGKPLENEDPAVLTEGCSKGDHANCSDPAANCCECSCHVH